MNELVDFIAKELRERDYYEKPNVNSNSVSYYEDDVLVGLFNLAISIVRQQHKSVIKNEIEDNGYHSLFISKPCLGFIDQLYDYLLKLNVYDPKTDTRKPTSSANNPKIQLPKCRSSLSRSLCFDLLVELARSNLENYKYLLNKLIVLHKTSQITNKKYIDNKPKVQMNTSKNSLDYKYPFFNSSYTWDYWPRDDVRSPCGYVGLINLGATCYMATAMQQLFMINEARACILKSMINEAALANTDSHTSLAEKKSKGLYDNVLLELKRMFAFLQDSEKKAYNPRDFCKVYTMDQQPLNTAEQKDMQEFFTDLISKLEETSNVELKQLIKSLFGGVITNLVISLDCSHISCTLEEFYTVRCQVAGMKDIYDSLNEITVKDTLEGDNMYTCSKCSRKVRAEKRACFRQLPKILCFNTMRYTFNMVTMLKEKVNTHFSFPLQLNMSGYMEKNLIPSTLSYNANSNEDQAGAKEESNSPLSDTKSEDEESQDDESYIYELIGVTVHTGTAEGGHYYSFIRERGDKELESDAESSNEHRERPKKWYLFNDAEVKPFDAVNQLAAECFGGETTSKTYDTSSDKFMDLSVEKTNSAYMLFYERKAASKKLANQSQTVSLGATNEQANFATKDELFNLIWNDNMKFINDRHLFEHGYFNFIWELCDSVPRSLTNNNFIVSVKNEAEPNAKAKHSVLLACKLGVSFLLETYIHAREKPNMVQWIELLLKLFSSSSEACKWFIEYLTSSNENCMQWCVKIFFKCPNSAIRQMFQRLLVHTIKLAIREDKVCIEKFIQKFLELISVKSHKSAARKEENGGDKKASEEKNGTLETSNTSLLQSSLCSLIGTGGLNNTKYNIRFMSEYFGFLYEFARLGKEECLMLIKAGAISKCARFYLFNRRPQNSKLKKDTAKKSSKKSRRAEEKSSAKTKENEELTNKTKKNRNESLGNGDVEMENDPKKNESDNESMSSVKSPIRLKKATPSNSVMSSPSSDSVVLSCGSSLSSSASTISSSSSSSSLSSASSALSDDDIIPLHDQKSKLKVFEKLIGLVYFLSDKNSIYCHNLHHQSARKHKLSTQSAKENDADEAMAVDSPRNEDLAKKERKNSFSKNHAHVNGHHLKLNYFYKSILDEINLSQSMNTLFSIMRTNRCSHSHPNESQHANKKKNADALAVKFVNMCCKSIKRLQEKNPSENDRCVPFFTILGNCTLASFEIEAESLTEAGDFDMGIDNESREAGAHADCPNCQECRSIKTDFTQLVINKIEFLLDCAPFHTLKWLASVCALNKRIQKWLLDNLSIWVKKLLVAHKQTNIRFSAANLLVSLVPNRLFRETFTSNRNMLVPFKPPSQSSQNNVSIAEQLANQSSASLLNKSNSNSSLSSQNSSEQNFEFESAECKQVLHQIIKYLLSLIEDVAQYLFVNNDKTGKDSTDPSNSAANNAPSDGNKITSTSNRLIQYFTFLIYCMCTREEKALFVTYNQAIDKFWSIYFPNIANNHVYTNLNKQVAVHFFYQSLVNCPENASYILSHTIVNSTAQSSADAQSTKSKVVFTNKIARELPMCTVAVDHEDGDLISYNRQCLHPYYASIRLLCQHSPAYLREMTTHSNFQWAFKHIMPYSIQYPLAAQELNKCVQLFIHQERLKLGAQTESKTAKKKKKECKKQDELIVDDNNERLR